MDKYDKLFEDIEKKTTNGDLAWEVTSPAPYANLIFNNNYAFRAFECEYRPEGGNLYTVVMVEKKVPSYDDYEREYDRWVVEILILRGDELVFTLTDNFVDEKKLFDLCNYVESHSDEARDLFAPFEGGDDEDEDEEP